MLECKWRRNLTTSTPMCWSRTQLLTTPSVKTKVTRRRWCDGQVTSKGCMKCMLTHSFPDREMVCKTKTMVSRPKIAVLVSKSLVLVVILVVHSRSWSCLEVLLSQVNSRNDHTLLDNYWLLRIQDSSNKCHCCMCINLYC